MDLQITALKFQAEPSLFISRDASAFYDSSGHLGVLKLRSHLRKKGLPGNKGNGTHIKL